MGSRPNIMNGRVSAFANIACHLEQGKVSEVMEGGVYDLRSSFILGIHSQNTFDRRSFFRIARDAFA